MRVLPALTTVPGRCLHAQVATWQPRPHRPTTALAGTTCFVHSGSRLSDHESPAVSTDFGAGRRAPSHAPGTHAPAHNATPPRSATFGPQPRRAVPSGGL